MSTIHPVESVPKEGPVKADQHQKKDADWLVGVYVYMMPVNHTRTFPYLDSAPMN